MFSLAAMPAGAQKHSTIWLHNIIYYLLNQIQTFSKYQKFYTNNIVLFFHLVIFISWSFDDPLYNIKEFVLAFALQFLFKNCKIKRMIFVICNCLVKQQNYSIHSDFRLCCTEKVLTYFDLIKVWGFIIICARFDKKKYMLILFPLS